MRNVAVETYSMVQAGMSPTEVAAKLGVTRGCVYTRLQYVRNHKGMTLERESDRRFKTRAKVDEEPATETPAKARARIAREVAEGKRCSHVIFRGPCSLWLPCEEHGQR